MNKADNSSLDEQIRQYTELLMRQYSSKGNARATEPLIVPPPDYERPDEEAAAGIARPAMPAPVLMPAPMPIPAPKSPQQPPTGRSGMSPEEEYRQFAEENTQRGILHVQTLTARGTYPVVGVKVVVSKLFESGEYIIATQTTDNAGKTEGLLLPAPDRSLSGHPGSVRKPFAEYKVTVIHPDFATIVAMQLPIFAGESSLQALNMIPLSASPNGNTIEYMTTEPSDL